MVLFVDWLSERDVQQQHQQQQQQQNSSHVLPPPPPADLSWDPAIVTSGSVAPELPPGGGATDDAQPHWMASLQHLTDETSNHRLPFVQQFPTFNTGTIDSEFSETADDGFFYRVVLFVETTKTQINRCGFAVATREICCWLSNHAAESKADGSPCHHHRHCHCGPCHSGTQTHIPIPLPSQIYWER